jgi:hypothetical protein
MNSKEDTLKRKIPCFCDNAFSVEIPEEINFGTNPEYIAEIMDGSFMNFTCPSCGKKHKPEFPLTILWPEKNRRFEVLPELDRGEFYRLVKTRKKNEDRGETLIGYPELSDRIAVIRDDLEPAAVEALKYYILLKAEETYEGKEIGIWYQGKSPDALEFHLHGIREGEVAVTRVPLPVYEKTLDDYKKHPKGEVFASLRHQSYLSVQNVRRPEGLK